MSADPFDVDTSAASRQRLWGFAVLIAIAVIVLPLMLDGAGSESKFRRVEKLREEPPRIVDELGNRTILKIPDSLSINSPLASADNEQQLAENSVAELGQAKPAESRVSDATVSQQLSDAGSVGQSSSQTDNTAAYAELAERASSERTILEAADTQTDVSGNKVQIVDGRNTLADNADNSELAVAAALEAGADTPLDSSQATQMSTQASNLTAWVVLAGAFDQEGDALAVRDQLRAEGFASFVRDRDNSDNSFQVLVGPMIKEQGALDTLERVANLLDGAPVVMSYP